MARGTKRRAGHECHAGVDDQVLGELKIIGDAIDGTDHALHRGKNVKGAVGRQEVGFLPGDLTDKLEPWMAAVHDNLYALFSHAEGSPRDAVDELFERDVLEMAAVTYLRGRSITGELVIVDEAQNLELPTLKVILTRMGADSKVVFCGDLTQVDNPYVSPFGGLAAMIEKFKGNPLFGHVTLDRTVRSPLAEYAANIL
mgnify:CR=1 FL=1